MFDEDNRDKSHFQTRPAARIRVSGPDGEVQTIECAEFTIGPAPLTIDYSAKLEAARQIANNEGAIAEQVASQLEAIDPVLSAAIRRELARRATRPQPARPVRGARRY